MRADNAAEKLKAMVSTKATVVRDGKDVELPLHIWFRATYRLAAGDMVREMYGCFRQRFIHQSGGPYGRIAASGENRAPSPAEVANPLELPDICFLVLMWRAALDAVVSYRDKTYFGSLAASIVGTEK